MCAAEMQEYACAPQPGVAACGQTQKNSCICGSYHCLVLNTLVGSMRSELLHAAPCCEATAVHGANVQARSTDYMSSQPNTSCGKSCMGCNKSYLNMMLWHVVRFLPGTTSSSS
jgi:hypothetical protein